RAGDRAFRIVRWVVSPDERVRTVARSPWFAHGHACLEEPATSIGSVGFSQPPIPTETSARKNRIWKPGFIRARIERYVGVSFGIELRCYRRMRACCRGHMAMAKPLGRLGDSV